MALEQLRLVPEAVQLWGELPPSPCVSIVGTRKPSDEGARAAFDLAFELARAGVSILSGGARGIDSAAHRGALAGGGRTLVVAPTWLHAAYPKENRNLFREILDSGGGYLTLAEPGQQPLNPAFFRRNEALAAMSDAVVVGECRVRSGARNALHHARRMNKPRFCLPGPFGSALSAGPFIEASELGASFLISIDPIIKTLSLFERSWESAAFVRHLSRQSRLLASKKNEKRALPGSLAPRPPKTLGGEPPLLGGADPIGRRVARAIWAGCGTTDAVALETGLEVAKIQHQILLLTLQGVVFEDESGVLRYHARRDE